MSGSSAPSLRTRLTRLAESATTPLVPADFFDLFAPLRAGADLRGRIESVHAETPDAATLVIRPGADWAGHQPGQYLRIGVDVDGVRQWRAYSLTHGPRADGRISITVKAVPDGPGQQPPRPRGRARHAGPPRAGGRRVRAGLRPRQAALRHRRLGHHARHRDAAQPLPEHRQGRPQARPEQGPRHRRRPRRAQRARLDLPARPAGPRRVRRDQADRAVRRRARRPQGRRPRRPGARPRRAPHPRVRTGRTPRRARGAPRRRRPGAGHRAVPHRAGRARRRRHRRLRQRHDARARRWHPRSSTPPKRRAS
ncbi:FAD-binding oxidoreductase [Nocardioides sp. B-3]|uniref:FAD-binding oxidoreductase n=1 Tax=Nocardioides sp. B-3 TaxID=2895565 RepID=UPI0021533EEA|nr:FAD-binding oxidoreductase [Nocardioides sp. B-3]UUZ61680.1 FAD-binding oxidoreductase [Nocardioides sp. B-3]